MVATLFAIIIVAQASASAPVPQPKQELVCRKSQQETGSRIRKGRRCKTAEEWAREDEERSRMAPSVRITEGQGDSLTRSPPH